MLRHLQAGVIDLHHFLVRNKNLGNRFYIGINILFEQVLLNRNNPAQSRFVFFERFHPLHQAVVLTPHSEGKNILSGTKFLQTSGPILDYIRRISHKIIVAASVHIPFGGGIASQGLTVGTSYQNAVFTGHLGIAFDLIKGPGTFVHGRPNGIGAQTQQKLKDLFVSLRTDHSFALLRSQSLRSPGHQPPIFVVDKYTPIFHGGLLFYSFQREFKRFKFFRAGIGKIMPGRHPDHPRKFQYSISQPPGLTAAHDQLRFPAAFAQTDSKGFSSPAV